MTRANTVGVIAEAAGVPVHCVEYVIRSRKIKPVCRAGIARVFDDDAVEQIKDELMKMGRTVAATA